MARIKRHKVFVKNIWVSVRGGRRGEKINLSPLARYKYKTVRANKVCYYRTKRDWALNRPSKVYRV